MNTVQIAKRMVIIVFILVAVTQVFYTFLNLQIFKDQYEKVNKEQAVDFGKVIGQYFSVPINHGIPFERITGVQEFLYELLETTPCIAFVQIAQNDNVLFSAEVAHKFQEVVSVPIIGNNGEIIAEVRLGMINKVMERSRKLLIDLATIIIASLVYTYELLIFVASFVIVAPGGHMVAELSSSVVTFNPGNGRKKYLGEEFESVLLEMEKKIIPMRLILETFLYSLKRLATAVRVKAHSGKRGILSQIELYKNQIEKIIKSDKSVSVKIFPGHVRPIVATFILAANLQTSFLPIFTEELLIVPTFFDNLFPQEILTGLPITLYMLAVTSTLMLLGTEYCSRLKPYHAIVGGLTVAAFGFVSCGFAVNIIHLIAGRMMCAVGFSMIVFYCRQYIVDNSNPRNRALNLAGYTAAFSGGLLCSIVVGGIFTEYFSYKAVYLLSAAMMLIVLKFSHMIFSDYVPAGKKTTADREEKKFLFFLKLLFKDSELLTIFILGVVTRIVFVGFFYYTLPIFLKKYLSFSDIGRVMMFYAITNILLSTWLNRFVKSIKGSIWGIFTANLILGISMYIFMEFNFDNTVYIILSTIGLLVVLSISTSITFPSQVNLLLNTRTVKKTGSHTPMAVFQSIERVGSALGPVVFGTITVWCDIHLAVGFVGGLCMVSAIAFLAVYRKYIFGYTN